MANLGDISGQLNCSPTHRDMKRWNCKFIYLYFECKWVITVFLIPVYFNVLYLNILFRNVIIVCEFSCYYKIFIPVNFRRIIKMYIFISTRFFFSFVCNILACYRLKSCLVKKFRKMFIEMLLYKILYWWYKETSGSAKTTWRIIYFTLS